ncbi:thioredoxin H-type 9 isoform X2 [Wolffia australiana]
MGNCNFCLRSDNEYESDQKVDFKSGNVEVITSKEVWDERISQAARDGKMVVANFSASWCGPCKLVAPLYGELSLKYPSLIFITVDIDQLTEFSATLDIRATPTFFFLTNGQQVDRLVGANKPELEKRVLAFAESASF